MREEYRKELEGIVMGEEGKAALASELEREMEARAVRQGTAPAKKRRARMPLRVAAALAACLALGSGAAYAASPYVSVLDALDALFNGAPAKTEVADSIGRPIGASATDNGVTVSAESIIGDGQSYSVIYRIAFDDGVPDGLGAEDRTLVMDGSSHILGTAGMGGASYFYDDDAGDNAIYYVEQMSVTSGEKIIGRTCIADFDGIKSMYSGAEAAASADNEKERVLAEGRWHLRFAVDYLDTTVALASGQAIRVGGDSAIVTEAKISPVSVTLAYDIDRAFDSNDEIERHLGGAGALTIVMTDGSEKSMDLDTFAGMVSSKGGVTHCRLNKILDSVIDLDNVKCIEVGGATLAMPEAGR